jgi:hypothetical protein
LAASSLPNTFSNNKTSEHIVPNTASSNKSKPKEPPLASPHFITFQRKSQSISASEPKLSSIQNQTFQRQNPNFPMPKPKHVIAQIIGKNQSFAITSIDTHQEYCDFHSFPITI